MIVKAGLQDNGIHDNILSIIKTYKEELTTIPTVKCHFLSKKNNPQRIYCLYSLDVLCQQCLTFTTPMKTCLFRLVHLLSQQQTSFSNTVVFLCPWFGIHRVLYMVNYNLQKSQMENSRNNHCIKFPTVCHSGQFGSILHNPSLFAGKNHPFVQLLCAAGYLPPSHSVALPVLRSAIMTSQSLCYISLILFNSSPKV